LSASLRYACITLLLLSFFGAGSLCAQWNKVAQFNGERGTCGFFWNELNGLVGFGNGFFGAGINALILRTTDGGKTWVNCTIPPAQGEVSSIFMKDHSVGYASIYESTNPPRTYTIWKTTDGGITWQDHTFPNDAAITTCVYATSKALVRTTWFDGNIGGRSLDDGVTFSKTFSNQNGDRSNGIDFSDDVNGVVSMGPSNNQFNTIWGTQDGGVTWNEGDAIPEAWSVYALKGTKTFFAMPEGQSSVWNWDLYRTDDGGTSWNAGFTFPFNDLFTGHIGGALSTLYVQTSSARPRGLFRSDDLGTTWKNVGGPSNDRDTRFAVTGCSGEVVYAFDNSGGIWKTTNGGDGTLHGSGGNGTLSLAPPSLSISNSCGPARGYITLSNVNCDSLVVDSITLSPNANKEFSVDTTTSNFIMFSNSSVGVPILFQSDSDVTRNTIIHIHAHSSSRVIDTTVSLQAQHSTISGPIMSLPFDSVYMETRYCQPLRRLIAIANRNCDSLIIDSVLMNPQYPEFIIDTSQTPKLTLGKNSSGAIPVFYETDSNLTRQTTMRIIAHSLDRKIDTTIILVAKHSTAPEPLLITPPTAKIGDQVLIPVYLRPTTDSFTITHYTFHLSYDGDVLTLVSAPNQYSTISTLSAGETVTIGPTEPSGALCTVNFTSPITEASNLTLPLIYLRMGVTLSRNLFSAIRLDTFSISNTAPLPLCTIPETMFMVDPLCGDSIISKYMLNGTMPGFLSVYPNPNSGSGIEAEIYVPKENSLSLEITDAEGKNIQRIFDEKYFASGKYMLPINTSSLSSGKYILHIRTADGFSRQQEIIVLR